MAREVRITGTFVTGTTDDNAESAKLNCTKLLKRVLAKAKCLEANDLFQFEMKKVTTTKL